jgi:2'-5' RNA ligase
MSSEGLYFIKIDLAGKEKSYLKSKVGKINRMEKVGKFEEDFHLTVEQSLYCPKKSVRVDLDSWLEMQEPFNLVFDQIDYFKNRKSGLIYLTPASVNDRMMISDFHYGVHEIIKSNNIDRQNNFFYVPHITLLREVPYGKLDDIANRFSGEIKPLEIKVSEITVREKRNNIWQDFRRFNLGKRVISSDQFCQDQAF